MGFYQDHKQGLEIAVLTPDTDVKLYMKKIPGSFGGTNPYPEAPTTTPLVIPESAGACGNNTGPVKINLT